MPRSDWELIQGCRSGDELAWDELVARYERLVFSIPLNFGLERQDAADVMQHTFIVLMESLNSLREDGNLAGWLSVVARRHTWRLAERSRRNAPGGEDALMVVRDATAEEYRERWERVQWLHAGLIKLDDRCRRLLLALYFADEPPAYEEVAAAMGLAVGSIGPTRARCLQRLRELL